MARRKSDIPERAKALAVAPALDEFHIGGKVVGQRRFNASGRLILETPLRDGRKHGREITWDDDGVLELVEPYADGKIHGTAKQYDRRGRVVGTYKMVHGTGQDIWRTQSVGGAWYVSESHSNRDGLLDGFVWWLNQDQRSVHEEQHWAHGRRHGVEREWNGAGKLRRGFPKYWISDRQVHRRQYLAAASKDPALPPFRVKDNSPRRDFAPKIRRLLTTSAPRRRR